MKSFPPQIGPYTITRELGRGGMGVVYLGHDTRLDRPVAIKALPEHLAMDPDRLARFEREARTLAQLNHPNVAGIHGVEEQGGQKFLVLEYVEGETLTERLDRGPVPMDEAIDIAIQIAQGLEAAHDKGVIHRDLKPGNIMLTREGAAKVLDFGLARTADGTPSSSSLPGETNSPTLTSPAYAHSPTIPGAIMGTAGYMSPEQARGRPVDKRSDIFSFGCVLYEMLVGGRPFAGDTVADVLGATLHKELDLAILPPQTPSGVRRLLQRCLEKDKRNRLHDIADARIELQSIESDEASTLGSARASNRFSAASLVAVCALAAALVGTGAWFLKPAPIFTAPPLAAPPITDTHIALPEGDVLGHGFSTGLAISRDGRMVAFPILADPTRTEPAGSLGRASWFSSRGLVIRRLDQHGLIPVPGTDASSAQPVFSPDGEWIAYVSDTVDIYKTPVSGGQPIRLATAPGRVLGLAWADDDTILIGQLFDRGLHQVSARGGSITSLTEPDEVSGVSHVLPCSLPGAAALYTELGSKLGDRSESIWAIDRATGSRTRLIENGAHAQYTDGHIVFVRDGELVAAPFDAEALRITGEERLLGESVVQLKHYGNVTLMTHAGQFALSPSGVLVMAEGTIPEQPENVAIWMDRDGKKTPIDVSPRSYLLARVTHDGSQILLATAYAPDRSLWLHDIERSVTRRIANPGAIWATLGPGERDVTYYREEQDGGAQLGFHPIGAPPSAFTPIETPGDKELIISEWSRDGRRLAAVGRLPGSAMQPVSEMRIWIYERDSGWSMLSSDTRYAEGFPAFSPDGRWLAFVSTESGANEVYVRPLDEPGPTQQVSIGGGTDPRWSRDGASIYYHVRPTADRPVGVVYQVEISGFEAASSRLRIGRPIPALETPATFMSINPLASWDIAPDGRFIFVTTAPQEDVDAAVRKLFPDRLRVIQNWSSRLAR